MNIAICGLLPEQVRFVQQEFPKHSLRFVDIDAQTGPSMKQAAQGCDKVILLTNFINHTTQSLVPPSKRILVRGGISKLRAQLNKMPTPVKTIATPAPVATAPAVQKGDVDYSPMKDRAIGDRVVIMRPRTCTLAQFEMRLANARSRWKKLGVHTSPPKKVEGGMAFTITAMRAPEAPVVATSETAPAQPAPSTPPETADMQQIAVEVQRPVAVAPVLTQARESAFWQSVFVETMKQWPGAPVDIIAARADEALRAYTGRVAVSLGDRH